MREIVSAQEGSDEEVGRLFDALLARGATASGELRLADLKPAVKHMVEAAEEDEAERARVGESALELRRRSAQAKDALAIVKASREEEARIAAMVEQQVWARGGTHRTHALFGSVRALRTALHGAPREAHTVKRPTPPHRNRQKNLGAAHIHRLPPMHTAPDPEHAHGRSIPALPAASRPRALARFSRCTYGSVSRSAL